jgi:hypothetical protein
MTVLTPLKRSAGNSGIDAALGRPERGNPCAPQKGDFALVHGSAPALRNAEAHFTIDYTLVLDGGRGPG